MFDDIEEYEKDRQKYLRNKTSHGRFLNRIDKWYDYAVLKIYNGGLRSEGFRRFCKWHCFIVFYLSIYLFWWFVHNCISHPIIGICPIKVAFRFHDYTSDKINLK